MKIVAFDLEGPLSPNDNAYELMGLFTGGREVFEAVSRYDDLLTLEGRLGYEPGDTLALIVPFLLYHGVTQARIVRLARKAALISGAQELIGRLMGRGWRVLCITTTYRPYARAIARRLGIPMKDVASTPLSLDQYRRDFAPEQLEPVERVEKALSPLRPERDDEKIKALLDDFYCRVLATSPLKGLLEEVRPVGGRRKVEALRRLVGDTPLEGVVVVGDSITDFPLFRAVGEAGGLAVAFNANQYALPYATMGLAAESLLPLEGVLLSWEEGGMGGARAFVEAGGERGLHWLVGKEERPLELHRHYRRLLRARAGELG
jgi:energy-converting hydrogenase A subunit R